MLTAKSLVCLVILTFASALHLNFNHQGSLTSGRVTLKSDNGRYLKRCHGCGGAYSDSASVNGQDSNDQLAIWTIQLVGDKVAFKADSGNYLSRCNNCWKQFQDSVFLHVPSLEGAPWSLWIPEQLSDGKWAFKGDNGKYLIRCSSCAQGKDTNQFAFVEGTSSGDSRAQWKVQYLVISQFPLGQINIYSNVGAFLNRCIDCKREQKIESPAVFQSAPQFKNAIWTAQLYGNKIALRADNGKYLARCENCYFQQALYPDSAFVYVEDPRNDPKALWSPQRVFMGRWALKADNGRYLTACKQCAERNPVTLAIHYGNYAFVYEQNVQNNIYLGHFDVYPAKVWNP